MYLGRSKDDATPVAVKVIKQFRFRRPGPDEVAVLREIGMMREIGKLETRNLLGAYSAFGQVFDTQRLCIVTPLCAGGDLFERIAGSGRYTERVAAQRFAEMMTGLQHLHEAGILHRDIKPENLLLSSGSDDDAVSVLADFGLSEYERECGPGSEAATQLVGTLAYNAPEHLTKHPVWSPAGDVWAAGIVLFIMLGGSPPFYVDHRLPKRTHDAALRKVICEGKFVFYESLFAEVSDRAKDLIRGMLTVDPAHRLTVRQCLEHPWLSDLGANPDVHLEANVRKLRAFNARRKLRAVAVACRWGAKSTVHQELMTLVGDTDFSPESVRAIAEAFRAAAAPPAATDAAATSGASTPSSTSPISELSADKEQFQAVMTTLGFDSLPLAHMWELFDTDGNGSVDVREVLCGLATLRTGGEAALELCFSLLDADKSGQLDQEELRIALTALTSAGSADLTPEQVSGMLEHAFDSMDVNKDGLISLEEFKAGIELDPELWRIFFDPIADTIAKAGTPKETS